LFSCVSTTVDPFWDISLDLGHGEKDNGRSSSGASAASTPDPNVPGIGDTHHYLEKLG